MTDTHHLDIRLQQAIDHLYEIFQTYRSAKGMQACTHCTSEAEIARLFSKPLRDLDWDDLGYYSRCAITTFGDLHDYKHFLPRILELTARDYGNSQCFPDLLAYKLEDSHFPEWDPGEVNAITDFLSALAAYLTPLQDQDPEASEILGTLKDEFIRFGFEIPRPSEI